MKSYGYFVILMILNDFAKLGFSQSGDNLFIWPQNEKLRTLYFMKLQKLNNIKYPYFLILEQNKKVMAILSFWYLRINK